jgi:hypothetical protein
VSPVAAGDAPTLWLFALFVAFLTPSLLLPIYRARQDSLEQRRLLSACSPYYCHTKTPKKHGIMFG